MDSGVARILTKGQTCAKFPKKFCSEATHPIILAKFLGGATTRKQQLASQLATSQRPVFWTI